MTRNFKALGAAFVAMLAMLAVSASAAQAAPADFSASEYPVFVTPEADSVNQVFSTTAGTLDCTTLSGKATLSAESTTLTATNVDYSNCEETGTSAEFDPVFNGCDLVFHAGEMTSPTTSKGTADIICPTGKSIEIGIPFFCLIKIGTQTGLGPVTYHNVAGGHVTVEAEVIDQLKSTHAGLICGIGSDSTGDYTGKITVSGVNEDEEAVNLAMTGT
jgi:hypothetical protein